MNEENGKTQIMLEGGNYETRLSRKFGMRKAYQKYNPNVISALIPGVIVEVNAAVGQSVKRGEVLMILDAMKMNNRIQAPFDARIQSLQVAAGDKVTKGQILLELTTNAG